jgi:NADH:ubiquinone oxidoreductase subunit E
MYNTQLKVTISRYYTPSGRCIQALDYAHKDKMELPYEPMKRTTTALKQEKEAFMMVAAFYRTYNWKKRKYYCKCTIEK